MPRLVTYSSLFRDMDLNNDKLTCQAPSKCNKQHPVIDLTKMSTQDQNLLGALLQKMPTKVRFKAGTAYKCKAGISNKPKAKSYTFKLSHTIIKRSCNPKGKNKGQYRYEVVSNDPSIGTGQSSTIFRTLGTIQPNISFKPKDRVVKVFDNLEDAAFTKNIYAEHEYRMTPSSLGMKPPVYINCIAHLFMRYVQGENLRDFIDNKRFTKLTHSEQVTFLRDLAKALKNQAVKKDRVHCDINPNNIKVHSSENKKRLSITIIDFGGALDSKLKTSHTTGTVGYKSPEADNRKMTAKSDIYSLCCIYKELCEQTNIKQFQTLFSQMTAKKPEKRPTIDQVVAELETAQVENKIAKLSF